MMPIGSGPRRDIPPEVVALAARCGAVGAEISSKRVALKQTGTMRADAARPWGRFRASQTIMLDRPGFAWRARTGPLGLVTVTDALDGEGARLTVTALGAFPLVRVASDDALTKGELLRYLAELPFAPDAFLHNTALDFEILADGVIRVGASHGGVHASIDLTLGADGFVVSAFARDRPRMEGSRTVERPWRCQLSDYRAHGGRQLPFAGEVAWIIDGTATPVWRGRMRSWRLV